MAVKRLPVAAPLLLDICLHIEEAGFLRLYSGSAKFDLRIKGYIQRAKKGGWILKNNDRGRKRCQVNQEIFF